MMKKLTTVLILMALCLALTSTVAYAERVSFGVRELLTNELMPLHDAPGLKTSNPGRVYVRHYLYGDFGGVYTNYFSASIGQQTTSPRLVGGSWVTPGIGNYIRSTAFTIGSYITLWGRANTNYGLTSIGIAGYMDTDA